MNTPANTTAPQSAGAQAYTSLSDFTTINSPHYTQRADGSYKDRPYTAVSVALTHETEDYVRVLNTLASVRPVLMRALRGTHGMKDGTLRYNEVIPHLNKLLDEIGGDIGQTLVDSVCNLEDKL